MPQPMRDLFSGLVPAILQTESGSAAFKTAYDIQDIQAVNDGDFNDFHALVNESRVDVLKILSER
jgi:hypothetical protein